MEKTIIIQTLIGFFEIKINEYNNLKDIKYKIQDYDPQYNIHFQFLVRLEKEKELTEEDILNLNEGEVIGLIMLNDIDIKIEEIQEMGLSHLFLRWFPSHTNMNNIYYTTNTNSKVITYCYLTPHKENTYFYEGVDENENENKNKKKYGYHELSKMFEDIINLNEWNIFYRELLIKKLTEVIYNRIPNPLYLMS